MGIERGRARTSHRSPEEAVVSRVCRNRRGEDPEPKPKLGEERGVFQTEVMPQRQAERWETRQEEEVASHARV